MPLNLELKARFASLARGREIALSLPASFVATFHHTDTYFCVPHGRCKLREFDDGTAELIAYRREESGSERWSEYIKAPIAEAELLHRALAMALGELVTVRKTRDLYVLGTARIHLDLVENLGEFIEFEVTGGDEQERTALLERLRKAFGLNEQDCIRGSYADMLRGVADQG